MKKNLTANRVLSLRSAYLFALAAMALVPLAGLSAEQTYCPADKPARCGGPSGSKWEDSWVCCRVDQVCGIYREDLHPFCQDTFENTQQSDDCFSAAYGDFQVCILRFNREKLICEHALQNAPGTTPQDHDSCRRASQILDDCAMKYDVDFFNCRQQSDGWERPTLPKPKPPASSPGSDDDLPSVKTELAPFTG